MIRSRAIVDWKVNVEGDAVNFYGEPNFRGYKVRVSVAFHALEHGQPSPG